MRQVWSPGAMLVGAALVCGCSSEEEPALIPFMEIDLNTFYMGCTDAQGLQCADDERPPHRVTLTRRFLMAQTELTQDQYRRLTGMSPSEFRECGASCPAENLSWYDAATAANALSAIEGIEACYTCDAGECEPVADVYACEGYRMPTEAEWEGAARCGTDFVYAGSDDAEEVAWTFEISENTTHPVGELAPNTCGLYDMSGNVGEWVGDWYDAEWYDKAHGDDPAGPESGSERVVRGGSWGSSDWDSRVTPRFGLEPDVRHRTWGVRFARSLP